MIWSQNDGENCGYEVYEDHSTLRMKADYKMLGHDKCL